MQYNIPTLLFVRIAQPCCSELALHNQYQNPENKDNLWNLLRNHLLAVFLTGNEILPQ